jgi:methionine-rich copper-binding protein CopC
LIDCTYHWSSTTVTQGTPIFGTPSHPIGTILSVDTTSWAVAQCPENYIAKRLLCATASVAAPAQAASDDHVTALPLPKPWVVRTAKDSPFLKSIHVETPLDLAAVLGFYRVELSRRGWTENDGAVVAPDRAVITFTTTDGPALLRLIHQDGRTIADLSLRKPADVEKTDILPSPGQVKLMFGNQTDEEAVITINEQTIALAARAGRELANAGRKLQDSPKIDLPPGKYKVTFKVASFAAQDREFEVGADETWGLLVGPAGVPLPVHLY